MTDTNVSSLVLKKGSNRYIFDPSGNLDLSNYYTKSEIDTKFNNYALKTEIPDTSTLATKTELNSVKSTATTANNTANSAKTTAQNALNTANSNGFKTVYKALSVKYNVTSVALTDNFFLKNYTQENVPSPYVDGFAINALDSPMYSNSEYYKYFIGIISKGKTLSNLGPSLSLNDVIGEYVH